MSKIQRIGEKVRFSLPTWSIEIYCPKDKFVYIITKDYPRVCLISVYDGEITPFLSIEENAFSCLQSQLTIHATFQITDAQGCNKIGFQDLQGLVGLDDFEVDKEVIFPNPVQQLLNLNLEVAIQKLDLLDVSGRLIQSYSLTNSNVQQVDVSSLVSGFYLISFIQDNATVFKRFIKD